MENADEVLRAKWIRSYFLKICLICIVVGVLLCIGKMICFSVRPYWYSTDYFYSFFRFVDDHVLECGLITIMLIIFLSTALELARISKVIGQITNGVKIIYSGEDEQISLPKDFREIEIGLRQIQLDAKSNAQAAREADQRKNDMIMYMAHDLKTPLTSVIGYLSLIDEEKTLPDHIKEKYVGIALKKALRLEELINGFFEIARFNFTHMILEKTTINMSMMLSQIVVEFEPIFREKGLRYSLDIQPDVMVVCDTEKMERVYDNLFKNIASYSYPNSEIAVKLEKSQGGGMRLVTVNKGKTIPQELLDHIFDQFFRIDSSRNSENGGSGLGLAVTKEIINLHGGTICCTSANEKIMFEIRIP